jgi:3-oxo-5-alpha-steroid 4-dehydrogenase 3
MDSATGLLSLGEKTPAEWCQVFFVVSTASVFTVHILPDDMRQAVLNYGARRPEQSQAPGRKAEEEDAPKEGFLMVLTSYAQVPHSWFIQFYMVSVLWSTFWGWQYLSKGSFMRALAERQHQSAVDSQTPEVELSATLVTWFLMSSQGARRLLECIFVAKPGSSPMSALHWALGLAYYTALGISVWIHGSGLSRVLAMFCNWLISPSEVILTRIRRANSSIVGVPAANSLHTTNHNRGSSLWIRRCSAEPLPQILGEPQEIYASK